VKFNTHIRAQTAGATRFWTFGRTRCVYVMAIETRERGGWKTITINLIYVFLCDFYELIFDTSWIFRRGSLLSNYRNWARI